MLDLQKQTLEAQEKSTESIEKTIAETLEKQLLQAEANLELLKSQFELEQSKAGELSLWNKIQIAAGGVLGTSQIITEEEKKRLEELEKGVNTQLKSIEQIRLKQAQADKEKRDEFKAECRRVV